MYFIVRLGWTLVKFTACVAFFLRLQCLWGVGVWTFVAFYNFVAFMWVGVVHSALVWCLACVCFFLPYIGGCLWVWCIGAQASPGHEPLLSELGFCSEVPSAWRGGSWLEGAGLPAMGA